MAKTEEHTSPSGEKLLLRFRRSSVDGVRGVLWAWRDAAKPDADPETGETNWSDESGPEPTIADARAFAHECIAGWV